MKRKVDPYVEIEPEAILASCGGKARHSAVGWELQDGEVNMRKRQS